MLFFLVIISAFTLSLRFGRNSYPGAAWFAWFAGIGTFIYACALRSISAIDVFGMLASSIIGGYYSPEIVILFKTIYRKPVRLVLTLIGLGIGYIGYTAQSELVMLIATILIIILNVLFYTKDKIEGISPFLPTENRQ